MTLTELVEKVSKRTGYSREEAWAICEELISTMIQSLHSGEPLKIRNLGTFSWVEHKARVRRHPATGEELEIPARLVLKFKPAGPLRTKEKQRGKVRRRDRQGEGQGGKRKGTGKVSLVREGAGFRWRVS